MAEPDLRVPRASSPARAPIRLRRWLWGLLALVALVVAGIVALVAWLGSAAGLRFALHELEVRSGGRIVVDEPRGSLLSGVSADAVRYVDGDTRVTARGVLLQWSPRALLTRQIHVSALDAREIVVLPGGSATKSRLPESLALPFDVVVDRVAVKRFEVRTADAHWAIDDIAFGYRGGPDGQRVSDIALAAAAGTLTGSLEIAARPPFAVRGAFALTGNAQLHSPRINVAMGGSLDALDLKAAGRMGEATLTASARLQPTHLTPLRSLTLDVRTLDLQVLDPALPQTALDIAMTGTPAADAMLTGSFRATNAAPGSIDRHRAPLSALRAQFSLTHDALAIDDLAATLRDGGHASGSGRLQLAAGQPGVAGSEWKLRLRDMNLAALYSTLVATRLSGTVDATLASARQHVVIDLTQRGMSLAAEATIAGTTILLPRFTARAEGGELAGHGRFDWSGSRPFELTAAARRLDPSRFGAFPGAMLDGSIDVAGDLQPTWKVRGTVALASTSRLRGVAVSGRASGEADTHHVRDLVADLRAAGAGMHLQGNLGRPGDQLAFSVQAPRLQALAPLAGPAWPDTLSGAVQASGRLTGTYDGLGATVKAQGSHLAWGDASLGALDATLDVAPGPGYAALALRNRALSVALRATAVRQGDRRYDLVSGALDGTLAQHRATFALKGGDLDAQAKLVGGFAPSATFSAATLAWSGNIASLENRGIYAARLSAPATLAASRTRVTLSEANIALPEGAAHIARFDWDHGRITSRGQFSGLPVAALARLSARDLPLRSTLVVAGDWDIVSSPALDGTLHIRREHGDLFVPTSDALAGGELAFGLRELQLAATLNNDAVTARAVVRTARLGDITANLALDRVAGAPPGRLAPNAPLHGTLKASLASLQPLQPFMGTTALVDGAVRIDVALGGTLQAPRATGTVDATGLRVDAPQFGVHWREGVLQAHLDHDVLRLDQFAVVAGDGRFRVEGTIPLAAFDAKAGSERAIHLAWHAERFRMANRPDLRLVVSGDGSVGFARGRVALQGDLRIDEGAIEFEHTQGAKLGDDVVVVGRPREPAERRFDHVPLDLALNADLGSKLTIGGSGILTTLAGKVRVTTTSTGTLQARGTLHTVHGTYAAFGQQLSIERGQLVFDGPIDNPTLDIVALRKNLPVEAGVEITGSARLPQVRLTSNPPVPEGEKLSWLVLGQGLERTSGTDTAALQAAAAALFGGNGPSFGKRIANRIGLDDVAVRAASGTTGSSASGLDSQVLAFSKRLSDRLYLVYEAGLNMANNALRIEYTLTRSLTLRAQAGAVSSLGIYFLRSFE